MVNAGAAIGYIACFLLIFHIFSAAGQVRCINLQADAQHVIAGRSLYAAAAALIIHTCLFFFYMSISQINTLQLMSHLASPFQVPPGSETSPVIYYDAGSKAILPPALIRSTLRTPCIILSYNKGYSEIKEIASNTCYKP